MKTKNKACVTIVTVARFGAGWSLLVMCLLLSITRGICGQAELATFEAHLRGSVVDKRTLDVFLDPKELSWAKFDPVTGYRLGNYMPRDGIDRSSTISTVGSYGMRTARAYVNQPCRINTYGD